MEIRAQDRLGTTDVDSLMRLMHLASITHKYDFESLYDWTTSVICALCSKKVSNPPRRFLEAFTQEVLESLLPLAQYCDLNILNGVRAEWLQRIPCYLRNPEDFRRSLDFVVEVGSPKFLGRAYYNSLRSMGKFALGSSIKGNVLSESHLGEIMSALTVDQRLRLYRGLWSLLSLQSKLQRVPQIELVEETCTENTHEVCLSFWSSLWKEKDNKHNGLTSIDPGELIDEAMAKFKSKGAKVRCHGSLERQLNALEKDFYSKLHKYFT